MVFQSCFLALVFIPMLTTGQEAPQAAVARLEMSAAAMPSDPSVWFDLGRARAVLAAREYQEVLKLTTPDSAFALAIQGDSLMHRVQYRRAFGVFQDALRKDPNLASARAALVEIYRAYGHSDWAQRELDALKQMDCMSHTLACLDRGGHYAELLSRTEGRRDAEAHYWRGESFSALSYEAFSHLMNLPPSVEMYRFKAGLQYEAGHPAEVVAELKKALQFGPGDISLKQDMAMALGAANRFAEAYSMATELLKLNPQSAELNALAGDALLNQQKAAESIVYFRKSLSLNGANWVTHNSLGQAYMQTGQWTLARIELEAATKSDKDGSAHYALARVYRQLKLPDLAATAMDRYRALSEKTAVPPEPHIVEPQS